MKSEGGCLGGVGVERSCLIFFIRWGKGRCNAGCFRGLDSVVGVGLFYFEFW